MTPTSHYRGLPVSAGLAAGQVYPGDAAARPAERAPATPEQVREAFAAVARERSALAAQLRERGLGDQAEIVGIGALIAADPALIDPAVAAVKEGGDGVAAVERSAAAAAAAIAALPNQDLAARADDVRQVAAAVIARLVDGAAGPPVDGAAGPPPASDFILVRRDVDPADLIRLAEGALTGAVSVSGGASSHAAIIARGLGIPMLTGADPQVLQAPAGKIAILDASTGTLTIDPDPDALAGVAGLTSAAAGAARPATTGAASQAGQNPAQATPPHTADGQRVTLLCNVASAAETRLGLANGAAGVGLLRTEIPFTGATAWPTEAEHAAALGPVLGLLAGRPAVVRLLDFSGDKIPPFLAGAPAGAVAGAAAHAEARYPSGLAALLAEPGALAGQLRAVVRGGRDTRLAVMVPMVAAVAELTEVRAALVAAAAQAGSAVPEFGMMVEVAATAAAAERFAPHVDFFSVGTNDLTSEVLGLDRADPRMRPAMAADPRVLALVSHVVHAAGAAGVKISVCGDAAADPAVLPLLIGLGVRTFSVGAASLPRVAAWIAAADSTACADQAASALRAPAQARVTAL